MIAGSDDALDTAADLLELAEAAVREIAACWCYRRRVAHRGPSSPLAAVVRGTLRYVDSTAIGTPGAFQAWTLTVDLAANDVRHELGFDAWALVIDVDIRGQRHDRAAAARGWRRREVGENLRRSYWGLACEFARRGVAKRLDESM